MLETNLAPFTLKARMRLILHALIELKFQLLKFKFRILWEIEKAPKFWAPQVWSWNQDTVI